jgi:hypothetical protein
MTTMPLPRLPRRTRTHSTTPAAAFSWTPSGGWTRPSPTILRAMEAALARWSA